MDAKWFLIIAEYITDKQEKALATTAGHLAAKETK